MWEGFMNSLKAVGIHPPTLLAAFVGTLVACGFMPKLTFKQALTVVCSGMAVNSYLVPLAFHYLGLVKNGELQSAIAFLAGLLGMRVIIVFMKWSEKIESPADLLHPFKDDKK